MRRFINKIELSRRERLNVASLGKKEKKRPTRASRNCREILKEEKKKHVSEKGGGKKNKKISNSEVRRRTWSTRTVKKQGGEISHGHYSEGNQRHLK